MIVWPWAVPTFGHDVNEDQRLLFFKGIKWKRETGDSSEKEENLSGTKIVVVSFVEAAVSEIIDFVSIIAVVSKLHLVKEKALHFEFSAFSDNF